MENAPGKTECGFQFCDLGEPSKTWNPMGLILNKALFASFQGYPFGPLMLFNK